MTILRTLSASTALALIAGTAGAQMPSASAAAFGMAGNYSAAARGYDALAWNPAGLGLDGGPAFSLNLLSGGGTTGLDPVKFNDIADYGGKIIPANVKEQWLQKIGSGSERGSVDGSLSILALSIGRIGIQGGIVATGDANLNQDAAEALLFGNAGRTGTPRSFNFAGSNANGSVFAVGGAGFGIPLSHGEHGEQLSLGVGGHYIRGIGAARAADAGSRVTPDTVNVQFPTIYTDTSHIANAGSGVAMDLGLAYSNGATTFSAAVRNVVNTFSWSPSAFKSRVGTLTFDGTTQKSDFKEAPYESAPAAMRAALEAEKFKPEVAVGMAHRTGSLLLALDGSERVGDGIAIGPKMHVGVGAEYTGLPLLSLRAGAAAVTDGFQAAGGLGIRIGSYELGAAASTRSRTNGQELGLMVSLLSIR